jgi:hypothetical protein
VTTEPVAFTSTRYRCPHCWTKTYRAKARAVAHAAVCFRNPERRTCRTCKHAEGPDGMSLRSSGGYTAQCAIDQLAWNQAYCTTCGAEVYPDSSGCEHASSVKPVTDMRVLCPSWEERS